MQDALDFRLMEHGGPAELKAASQRVKARMDSDEAQRQADLDYTEMGIRIAGRY